MRETLGEVYGYDEQARVQGLSAEERLHFHQEQSKPVMEKLQAWLQAQFEERKVEPNSAGVSKAEIARRLQIGRTSVRRILAAYFKEK